MLILNLIKQNPILRILIAYIIGIFVASATFFSIEMVSLIAGALFIGFILSINIPYIKKSYRLRWVAGLFGFLLWTSISVYFCQERSDKLDKFTSDTNTKNYYGYVSSIPLKYKNGVKFNFKVCAQNVNDSSKVWNETILVYQRKDSASNSFEYGENIVLKAKCNILENKGNPEEFDYKSYLNRKGIARTCFVSDEDIFVFEGRSGNTLMSLAYQLRNRLYLLYKENGIEGEVLGVVSALTLGYKEDLDEDSVKSFRESGAMHIMAVSGLHVGIIQMILNAIFSFLIRIKGGRHIRMIIVILLLWFYALLTGLSPSVLRAALMFSLIQIGLSISREISIYNIIGLSALVVLIINPLQIFDVGFQFSYLAVIGIIFFYPRIYLMIKTKWWLPDKIWSLIVASFSAQLSLAPLSIFYFNQFPNYFLVTNIVVIPLAFVIIFLAIGLFIGSIMPFIGMAFSFCLNYAGKMMIYFTEIVSSLPYSVSEGLYFNQYTVLLIYGLIITVSAFIWFKKVLFLKEFFVVLILALILSIISSTYPQDKMVIFNVDKGSAIYYQSNRNGVVICDSCLFDDTLKYSFYIDKFLLSEELDGCRKLLIRSEEGFQNGNVFFKDGFIISKNDLAMVIINDDRYFKKEVEIKMDIDILLLVDNVKYRIEDLLEIFNPKLIVVDASNYDSRIRKWEEDCEILGIDFYSTKEKGAFLLNLTN